LDSILGDSIPYATFFLAVAVAAWIGGWRPALLAAVLGLVLADFLFVPPRYSLAISSSPHFVGLMMYFVVSLVIAGLGEATKFAQGRSAEQVERLRTTLASIGDGVISTDGDGKVTYLNTVAESLTGWINSDAVGVPLSQVFCIVNESTRIPIENPAIRSLKTGVIVGLLESDKGWPCSVQNP
jgi:K+-sensing histidine kinase KdpD